MRSFGTGSKWANGGSDKRLLGAVGSAYGADPLIVQATTEIIHLHRLAAQGELDLLDRRVAMVEGLLDRASAPAALTGPLRTQVRTCQRQAYLLAVDRALMRGTAAAFEAGGGNRLAAIEQARSLLARAIAAGADETLRGAIQRKIDIVLYTGPVGVLAVHGRASARGDVAPNRAKNDKRYYTRFVEPQLQVHIDGRVGQTLDWSLGGLLLDISLPELLNRELTINLTRSPDTPSFPAQARLVKVDDTTSAIRFVKAHSRTVAFLRHAARDARSKS